MLQFKILILYGSLSWSGTEIERADLYILWRISLKIPFSKCLTLYILF